MFDQVEHTAIQELLQFALLHFALKKVITFCVRNLLHFALIVLLHFALMLLNFVLLLHFAAIVIIFCVSITFCGDYYILRRNKLNYYINIFASFATYIIDMVMPCKATIKTAWKQKFHSIFNTSS